MRPGPGTCACLLVSKPGSITWVCFSIAEKGTKRAWFKDLTIAMADEVVEQALLDAVNKKEISVYGLPMKLFRVFTKVVPHSIILNAYANAYKKQNYHLKREN